MVYFLTSESPQSAPSVVLERKEADESNENKERNSFG